LDLDAGKGDVFLMSLASSITPWNLAMAERSCHGSNRARHGNTFVGALTAATGCAWRAEMLHRQATRSICKMTPSGRAGRTGMGSLESAEAPQIRGGELQQVVMKGSGWRSKWSSRMRWSQGKSPMTMLLARAVKGSIGTPATCHHQCAKARSLPLEWIREQRCNTRGVRRLTSWEHL
jgi:hypothetical protein